MKNRLFPDSVLKTILSLVTSFVLSGCYTFSSIPVANLNNNPEHKRIQITMNDEQKILIEENQPVNFDPVENVLRFQKDSSTLSIDLNNAREIKEEKFNFQKTFFASLWIGGLSIIVLGLLLYAAASATIGSK